MPPCQPQIQRNARGDDQKPEPELAWVAIQRIQHDRQAGQDEDRGRDRVAERLHRCEAVGHRVRDGASERLDVQGVDELREQIEAAFEETLRPVELLVPYTAGDRLSETELLELLKRRDAMSASTSRSRSINADLVIRPTG